MTTLSNKPTEDNTSISTKSVITLGSIVALRSHPYSGDNTKIKIGAYNHFTPPLMVVIEKHDGRSFQADTGAKEKSSYKCMYYSTSKGTFEEDWFKKEQIKLISKADKSFCTEFKNKNLVTLKKELTGKMAILNSVDMELKKIQVYLDSKMDSDQLRQKPLLDFLPPVGTIIGVSLDENHVRYDEKSGNQILHKNRIRVKLRWYNNHKSKYSEQDVALSALREVMSHELEKFPSDTIFTYTMSYELEENDEVKIKMIPLRFYDIVFNHYYYEYRFTNCFNGKLVIIHQDKMGEMNGSSIDLKRLLDGDSEMIEFPGKNSFSDENEKEWKGQWYKIQYEDRAGKYTQRIILIRDKINLDESHVLDRDILKANCLLRDGAIRHFRLHRILGYRKIPESFVNTFVSKNDENILD